MYFFDGLELGAMRFASVAIGSSVIAGVAAHLLDGVARRTGLCSRSRRDRTSSSTMPRSEALPRMETH